MFPLEDGRRSVFAPAQFAGRSSACSLVGAAAPGDLAARRAQSVHARRLRRLSHRGAVFGKSTFYGVQRGPTSPGRTWLLDVTNVSITPYTYTEDFTGDEAVLAATT